MKKNIYKDGSYLKNNPTWHAEDSPWKTRHIIKLLKANKINAPDRKHKIRGRTGFVFSDVPKIIAEATLGSDFYRVRPVPVPNPTKIFCQNLVAHDSVTV